MRPLLLKGHTRSITYVRFNKEGDLLFTASKDNSPTVWRAATGDRLGTYDGHSGAVYSLDVTRDSKLLLTASADQSARLWDVQTGRELFTFTHRGAVKGVAWSEGEHEFATVADPFGMEVPACINVYEFAAKKENQTASPRLVIVDRASPRTKVTKVGWLPLDAGLLAAYDNGVLRRLDPATGEVVGEWKAHSGAISSFAFNEEKTLLVTSSHDQTSKLWDVAEMKVLRTYQADVPLNAAAISPAREHVIAGGGQEASAVTTTAASAGKFETRFFHMIFEQELGRIKGHFGPINTLAFHPEGKSFASGAEDGYIRLHLLDGEYSALGREFEDALDDPSLSAALQDGTCERLEAEEEEARLKEIEKARATAAVTGAAITA